MVVGIGASAGGIKALKELFSRLPAEPEMAFVVILHLSQRHESNLAQILQNTTAMPVEQVMETVRIEPNRVYVIPPGQDLEMVDGEIRLTPPSRIPGKRVAIDRFFRSLAEAYGRRAVCVVLSGTGSDGTLGLRHVKGSNGFAIVQDPDDAEYDGMPVSAIKTRIVDVILPAAAIADKLLLVRDSTRQLHLTGGEESSVAGEIKNVERLRDVLTLLRIRTGHDFSDYKRPTLIRRLARHLQIHETDDLREYLGILRENPDEVQSLINNLLINVTNFFRDREAFAALEEKIIPRLFEEKTAADAVRVWVAGCASGEEAYSMAMLLYEYAAGLPDPPKIQVFASDVDDEAIAEARESRYTGTIVEDVAPERLRNFFVKEEDGYRVRKQIREMILFASHNLLRDPPFSRLDLVSCRNVLIYLNRETQEKVLRIFHFALRDTGYLFLGASESAESVPQNFSAIDKKNRLYQSRPANAAWIMPPLLPMAGSWTVRLPELPAETRRNLQSFGELHHRLLEQYAPPSILINREDEILHLSESAGRFLRFVGGEPTSNLLKVVHPGLLPDLRAALYAARQEGKNIEAKNVRIDLEGAETLIDLTVRPVKLPEDFALVIFEEADDPKRVEDSVRAIVAGDAAMENLVQQMENELQTTKDRLRGTIEQYETTVEEHKASNEELQAINEELRSASEELETGKEELQSVNEELTTVNHELKEKIDEVSRANADLQNLMRSTEIATIFLDRDLRIKRFTPRAQEIFNVIQSDIGRPFEHLTHRLAPDDFAVDAALVLETLQSFEREVSSRDRHFYIVRFSPYRTLEDKIDGVVLTFIDITERKRAEEALRESEMKYRTLFETIDEGYCLIELIYDAADNAVDFVYLDVNLSFEKNTGLKNVVGRLGTEVAPNIEAHWFEANDRLIKTGEPLRFENYHEFTGRWYSAYASRVGGPGSRQIAMVFNDITERKRRERNQAFLTRIAGELVSFTGGAQSMKSLAANLGEYFGVKWCVFAERREDGESYSVQGWNAGDVPSLSGTHRLRDYLSDEQSVLDESGGLTAVGDTRTDPRTNAEKYDLLGIRSFVVAPLANNRQSGLLFSVIDDEPRAWRDDEIELIREIGGRIRTRLERARAESARRERELLQKLVGAQEEERRRIARDLHDELGQLLTALRLRLDSVQELCGGDEELSTKIAETRTLAKRLDEGVDFLAWELQPAPLDGLGLLDALDKYVREWTYYSGIRAEVVSSSVRGLRFAPEVEANLYRIVQEALNNVLKHARAKEAEVILEKRGGTIVLIVADDGVGFEPETAGLSNRGIGLTGMKERAALIGGELEIETAPGQGTTVYARIPAARREKKVEE
ncbi:MAG: PAS domain-containing protein [Acidobacteria bacterium]|nr:PAS domain-containing protein [Acidobacteriota bacterium]